MITTHGLRYRILGPLEVADGERRCTPSAPRLRTTLAMLVLRRGTPLTLAEILEELWGTDPPRSSTNSVQVFVMRLRRLLAPDLQPSDPRQVLCTTGAGYSLRVDASQLDVCHFEDLVAAGGRALDAGDDRGAARSLRDALALWQGYPLADVPAGPLLQAHALQLEEARLSTVELRVEADLRLARHRELVGELQTLVSQHPLREAFQRQLMLALYRSGRQAEALDVYRRMRQVLVEELGVEPGLEARRLHHAILTEDPSLAFGEQTTLAPVSHLPTDIADFTGRRDAVAEVREALSAEDGAPGSPGAVRLVVISGPAGTGKSTLALHVAHLLRPAFPDGQLYAHLGGWTGDRVPPAEVLTRFLRCLGVHDAAIPRSLEERSALLRTKLCGRRVLVILDDAADEAQVRPLLPAGRECAVLVTGRRRLSGLEGAIPVDLPEFTSQEAHEFLRRLCGGERIDTDPRSAGQIALLCGLLPLALRVAGAKLAAKPHWSAADLAQRLADGRRRLCELRIGDLDVRSSIAGSYRACDPLERRIFRLLPNNPPFTARVAAHAADAELCASETALERLVDLHLLRVRGRDPHGDVLYGFHELSRDYAIEAAQSDMEGGGTVPGGQDRAAGSLFPQSSALQSSARTSSRSAGSLA